MAKKHSGENSPIKKNAKKKTTKKKTTKRKSNIIIKQVFETIDIAKMVEGLEDHLDDNLALGRIFNLVFSQGCKSVLLEKEYKHGGYRKEYKKFYSKSFRQYPSTVDRLHFFKTKNLKIANLTKSKDDYLGFCTLRPIDSPKIIEAVISPPTYGTDPDGKVAICKAEYIVKIKVPNKKTPQKLSITGFPFIQPEGRIGSCAHGAIAAIDSYFCKKFKSISKARSIPDIKDITLPILGNGDNLPCGGLSPEGIQRTLQGMGYYAQVFTGHKGDPYPYDDLALLRMTHYYLESKIPIILGFPTATVGHAVLIIGHTTDPNSWWCIAQKPYYGVSSYVDERDAKYQHSSKHVEQLVIHDSYLGPYIRVPRSILWEDNPEEREIIIPSHANVYTRGSDVEYNAFQMIKNRTVWRAINEALEPGNLDDVTLGYLNKFINAYNQSDIILRTYLIDAKTFRKVKHSSYYNNIKMPDRIWITEISTPGLLTSAHCFGAIITDPTALLDCEPSVLSMHLPGIYIGRSGKGRTLKYDALIQEQDELSNVIFLD